MTDYTEAKFRVQHFPQVPCSPFVVNCSNLDAAILVTDALCNYDIFQFENQIKPDYSNASVIQWSHPIHTDGDWDDFDDLDLEDYLEENILQA